MPRIRRRTIRLGAGHLGAGHPREGKTRRRYRLRPALIPLWLLLAALALVPAPAMAIEGVWHGKYVCTQGPTGLTLTVTRTPDGSNWTARFCFCAIEENPRLPTGECELLGPIVPNEAIVKFTPWRWISQPEGWEMRPLELWLSADGQHILGRIDAAGCRLEFQLDKETRHSVRPACQCKMVTSQARTDAPR